MNYEVKEENVVIQSEVKLAGTVTGWNSISFPMLRRETICWNVRKI